MTKYLTGQEALDACRLPAEVAIRAMQQAVEDIGNGEAMTDVNRNTRRAYIKHYKSKIKNLQKRS